MCLLPAMAPAQNQQPPATAAPAAQTTASPPAQQNPKNAVPDYPEPRTLTFGAFYWMMDTGLNPDLRGGSQAPDYETLYGIGKPRPGTPGVEVSVPITRTGTLNFEIVQARGEGNQNAPVALDLFGQPFSPGEPLATQYGLLASKLYLDDLLFPHKFPVAKFRLKSLWEFEWVHVKTTIDDPTLQNTANEVIGTGTRQIFLPVFGIAAEYQLTPHILARADISGFGIPHKANVWDANATLSYRRGSWEIFGGGKVWHFKTSPNNSEYLVDTLAGVQAGLRWHWSL